MVVPITGGTPGRRYGHVLVYIRPNIILFGGNDGQKNTNDVWFMDVERSPFTWIQVNLEPGAKRPEKRVYHSADVSLFTNMLRKMDGNAFYIYTFVAFMINSIHIM